LRLFPKCTTLFVTPKVYNNLSSDDTTKAHIRIFNKREPVSTFINKIDTGAFDYIFVNTIQPSMIDLPKWRKFNPSCPSILTIHNINAWSKTGPFIRKNLIHTADSFVASFYKKRVMDKFTYLNVINESLMLSAMKSFPDKTIISIPFTIPIDTIKNDEIEKNTIDFVIPGTVDSRRRDYETVLDVFSILRKDFKNVRLILLGKSEERIRKTGVLTFNDYVPRETYDSYLRNADFIICPSYAETHTVNVATEYYGKTKSPNIFEAVKWRKPLFLPKNIPVPKAMKKMVIPYEGYEDLHNIMKFYVKNNDMYSKLMTDVNEAVNYYSLENVKRGIEKWIKEI